MAEEGGKVVEGENNNPQNLAESFRAEYGAKSGDISMAMSGLDFRFARLSSSDDEVIATGAKDDGTTITITIKKGMEYKSPAEKEQEYEDQQRMRRFNP